MYCSKCGTWALDSDTLCSNCGAALQVDREPIAVVAAPAPVPLPVPAYAGFWRRFATSIVDYAVTFPFLGAFRILLGIGPLQGFEWHREFLIVLAVETVVHWLYSALLESSRWQGTLGQQLLGVRVTDARQRRVSFLRATFRHAAQLLSYATFGIGFLMIAFHPRKQALHDLIAGCLLLREAPEAHRAPAAPPAAGWSPVGGGAS